MHLLDDIDSDVDLERELWDTAEEASMGRMGVVPLGFGGGGVGRSGELEEEQMVHSEGSTTKSVFGAWGSACNRRLGHDDDRDSERERERGLEYKGIRPEWRGVL
jgi:hypothetical protein